jgi:MFS family permease
MRRLVPALPPSPSGSARGVLAAAAALHVLHDGFSDVLYVLLPLWTGELGLTLTQVGVLRTAYSGGMAASQVPAGLLAERQGERRLLAAGTAVTALGFLAAAGGATGFASLVAILVVAGLGSGVQHPLASALVSRAYETGRRRAALGTYNFAGDVGKVLAPAVVALAATAAGWRPAAGVLGAAGLVAAVLVGLALARLGAGGPEPSAPGAGAGLAGWGIVDAGGFGALAAVGMLDTATRTALLTFLPFVLLAHGLALAGVGLALAVLFAGGAAGKFACGLLAERLGVVRTIVVTETATALGIVAVVLAPLPVALAVLAPLGVALNGTSSVLYATVADLATPERRARAYGVYYTLIVGASAAAPIVFGVLGDAAGAPATLLASAATVLPTLPLCAAIRTAIARAGRPVATPAPG